MSMESNGMGSSGPTSQVLPPHGLTAQQVARLDVLWQDLQPALEHLFKSPIDDTAKAPVLPVADYMRIYTAIFKFARRLDVIYTHTDQCYADIARETLLQAPATDRALVPYLLNRFRRFSAGARAASRLLAYIDRHYVTREMDEEKGLLRYPWFSDDEARNRVIRKKIAEMKAEKLEDWGFVEGGSRELRVQAEACAQAARSERVVPTTSLAYRRFRTEVIEPLLLPDAAVGERASGIHDSDIPECRLSRAVQALLDDQEMSHDAKKHDAGELALMLKTTGMKVTHPMWRYLNDYATSS